MATSNASQDTMKRANKKERIVVRVSVAEKGKFQHAAEICNTDVSELARQALHNKADEVLRNQAA